MKITAAILLVCTLVFAVNPSDGFKGVSSRYAGEVRELIAMEVDARDNITCLIRTDHRSYVVRTRSRLPFIYAGDSLFEYWVNYRKYGIGTNRNGQIYKISEAAVR